MLVYKSWDASERYNHANTLIAVHNKQKYLDICLFSWIFECNITWTSRRKLAVPTALVFLVTFRTWQVTQPSQSQPWFLRSRSGNGEQLKYSIHLFLFFLFLFAKDYPPKLSRRWSIGRKKNMVVRCLDLFIWFLRSIQLYFF